MRLKQLSWLAFLLSTSLAACSSDPTPPAGSGGNGGTAGSGDSGGSGGGTGGIGGTGGTGGIGGSGGSGGTGGIGGTGGTGGTGGIGGTGGSGGTGGVGGTGGGGGAGGSNLVVGVINAPNEIFINAASIHVVVKADGNIVHDELWGSGVPAPIPLPQEIKLEGLADNASIEVSLDTDYAGNGMLTNRLASTKVLPGKTPLLRVTLSQKNCFMSCDAGLTCNWGRCMDPFVPPEVLEEHSAGWTTHSWCKPEMPAPGAPMLVLGQGQTDFTALVDQGTIDVWAGDQGGHHVYVAMRQHNLKQTAVAKLTGTLDTGEVIGPASAVRVFKDDPANGYCETTGFLFRIDNDISIGNLLFKPMKLKAEVSDADGTMVTQEMNLVIGDIVGP